MSDSSRLPARPSLEQLQKQAKDLLKQYRAGENAAVERFRAVSVAEPVTLADAQFVLARELGFENWAKLKHKIEAAPPSGLAQFEELAKVLAEAYTTGDAMAIREMNWSLGLAFIHDHQRTKMQQRLPTWFASEDRTPELALEDARQMLARAYGFQGWAAFAEGLSRKSGSSSPPFYKIDRAKNEISVRGPMSPKDWDAICEIILEQRITRLNAGGMTDAGLERVARCEGLAQLELGNSNLLTDDGLMHLARMPQLEELGLGGPKGVITDRGLEVLRHLPELRQFQIWWQPNVSDAGLAHLASCHRLESVDLMGTPSGDGAIRALAGKSQLRRLKTGRNVTDAGLALLHGFPAFKAWQGGEIKYDLMSPDAGPTHLLVDGPFTDAGIASLARLDGLFGLTFFWHCPAFTSAGLAPLKNLSHLGYLGCQGVHCDDEAMRHIASIPRLRMLMAQDSVASDDGFIALSRSRSIESIFGRECANLTGRGFVALAAMPALRGLALSCKNVDDAALSTLPRFPALRELTPMGVSDDGFRHVGRCEQLESLTCMYCRDTGDIATGHIAGLNRLKKYYAGQTRITDLSLEILAQIHSLERLEFWACAGITDAGVAHLATLPHLREIIVEGSPKVTKETAGLFPARVHVGYSG